jgi:acetyl esterase/lipase
MLDGVSSSTTIGELCRNGELADVSDYLFTHMTDDVYNNTIGHYSDEKCGIIAALRRLCELKSEGRQIAFDYYSDAEKAADPNLRQTKLFYMPAPGGSDKPYIMVCPGGGYAREWVLVEGYPIAEQFNRLGYNAFVLIYRTGRPGLLPEPMEDLAKAVGYIGAHSAQFGVKTEGYAVTGFSAGGHLAAEWGSENEGYAKYGCEKPGALLLAYPATSCEFFYDAYLSLTDPAQRSGMGVYLKKLGGENFGRDILRRYSAEQHLGEFYPPTFLVHCKDDPTVPVISSAIFDRELTNAKVKHISEFPDHGGHSFGIGRGTGAEDWIKRAAAFWENNLDK